MFRYLYNLWQFCWRIFSGNQLQLQMLDALIKELVKLLPWLLLVVASLELLLLVFWITHHARWDFILWISSFILVVYLLLTVCNFFKVVLLESRDRLGGRIHTDYSFGCPVDMGASWKVLFYLIFIYALAFMKCAHVWWPLKYDRATIALFMKM